MAPGASPAATLSVAPSASPATDAPGEASVMQVALPAPAPAAREVAIGPLRMFLGLALIGGGLSVMLACLVFHLMYGTITFPRQGEAGQLTDLL